MIWPTLLLKHTLWCKIFIVKFSNIRKHLHFKQLKKMPRVEALRSRKLTCPLIHSLPGGKERISSRVKIFLILLQLPSQTKPRFVFLCSSTKKIDSCLQGAKNLVGENFTLLGNRYQKHHLQGNDFNHYILKTLLKNVF